MDNFELWYRYHKDKGDMPAGAGAFFKYEYGVKKHAGITAGYDPSTWAGIRSIVRAGKAAKYFIPHETQFAAERSGAGLVFDVLGIDHDTPSNTRYTHSMTLQLHDQFPTPLQFDAPEAFYYCEDGLAAGTYYFTIDSNYDPTNNDLAHYQFTLAQGVPAGGQLTFPWTSGKASAVKVISFASATSTTVIERVGVSEGTDGQNLGNLTAAGDFAHDLNAIHRVRYGSNRYKDSAIRQWLNSSAAAGSVWTPQTKWDRPPAWAANVAGFMYGMDADFLSAIGKTHIITARNTVCDGGGFDEMDDYFFLLSRREVYMGDEVSGVIEGEPYPYYSDYSDLSEPGTGADSNRIRYRGGAPQYWWNRTPYSGAGGIVRYVSTTGSLYNYSANSSYGVAPACNII